VCGFVLKVACHWNSDSSVVKDVLGEIYHTPLYVGLPSAWGSIDGDLMFSPISWEGSLYGDYDIYKSMNKPLAPKMEHLSLWGTCWGTWSGSFTGDFERNVSYQGMCRRGF